jgi:catechol 2,3-dioxygenase-like lactoylglutathione lyase family enzyme
MNEMSFSIEHVSLRCHDLEKSIAFYESMFGARVILRRNLTGGKRIVYLRLGTAMIELMDMGPALEVRDPREYYGVHHLGLKTDDFQAQYQSLKEKGAEFLGEPFEPKKGIQLVFLRDPNGAIIELSQRDPEVFEEAIAKGTVDW